MSGKKNVHTKAIEPTPKEAKAKFVRDALIRGDAQPLDEDGTLPASATHEIVKRGEKPEDTEIERVRFRAF